MLSKQRMVRIGSTGCMNENIHITGQDAVSYEVFTPPITTA